MKFASSYEPQNFETDIYAAWEAAGKFLKDIPGKELAVEGSESVSNERNDEKGSDTAEGSKNSPESE